LQLVSGASIYAYWLSTYAWDLLVYTVIAAVTMLVFALYRDTAMVGSFPKALGLWLLLVFFGAAVIPLSYCYAFCFSSHASAQVRQSVFFVALVRSGLRYSFSSFDRRRSPTAMFARPSFYFPTTTPRSSRATFLCK
jgi:hypothetical protein